MYIVSLLLPILSSIVTGFWGRKLGASGARVVSCFFIFTCLFVCLISAYEVILCQSSVHVVLWHWMTSDQIDINIAFHFDQISLCIIVVVSSISSLVHLYSCWYMASDPHQQRFLSYLSGFTFSMIILVSADNYLLIFVGWEWIGVLSFLLINFWITRIQASKAAIQAITVNRVGDMFLSIGFFVCLWTFGNVDYISIFSISSYINTNILNAIGILFLLACAGKSAQIGLHVWLVNAMEGPTPVSSMLHAATLVTAGIYLLMRSSPLLEYAPLSLVCILWTGSITCLFAATIGLLQSDMKRVIAFSTISQIGYLVMAVGLSQYSTALLHLSGHAYFKALLFLAAGGVIHSMSDEQDMRKLGGLITFLPFTYTAILVGSLSLMAIFPWSGFYSKDLILELAHGTYTFTSLSAYILGTITAGLTAFYSIRLIGLTFQGTSNANVNTYNHVHEQPFIVQIPFVILMILSIGYGYMTRDILSGLGSDGLMASTFQVVGPHASAIIDAEFQSQIIKLIPTIVTCVSASLAVYFYTFNPHFLLNLQESALGRFTYTFFNKKWLWDVVIGKILVLGINSGYYTSQTTDRGTLEIIGPRGVITNLYHYSNVLVRFDSGLVTTYASYMLLSTLSLMFVILMI